MNIFVKKIDMNIQQQNYVIHTYKLIVNFVLELLCKKIVLFWEWWYSGLDCFK